MALSHVDFVGKPANALRYLMVCLIIGGLYILFIASGVCLVMSVSTFLMHFYLLGQSRGGFLMFFYLNCLVAGCQY